MNKIENRIKIDNKEVGRRIREERQKLGLSREEFAEILEISDYYVGQLERGERQMSLSVLARVVNCLHVSIDYLILGKTINRVDYVSETCNVCYTCNFAKDNELYDLINKCSPRELELIKKLIKTILPYMN